jgi:putative membrane protein
MWKALLIRFIVITGCVPAAVLIVPNIGVYGRQAIFTVAGMAVLIGVVNVLIKPLLIGISCGCSVLSLGPFLLVANASILWATSQIAQLLNIGFYVGGFWPAFWAGLLISLVSFLMNLLITDNI